jgi:integrase/recombinase XerD
MSTSFDNELDRFCDALWLEDGLAPRSLESYRRDLTQLFTWLQTQNIAPEQRRTRPTSNAFLAHRTFDDEGIAARSLARQLTAIKRYQRWLLREGRRSDDPTLTVAAPRLPKPLPKIAVRGRC